MGIPRLCCLLAQTSLSPRTLHFANKLCQQLQLALGYGGGRMGVHLPALRLGCITDKWEIASAILWPGASIEPAAIGTSPWQCEAAPVQAGRGSMKTLGILIVVAAWGFCFLGHGAER